MSYFHCTPCLHTPLQVHLTYWSSTSLLASWASCDAVLGSARPVATSNAVNVVWYGTNPHSLDRKAEGVATSYAVDYTGVGASYASPVLHHVLLKGVRSVDASDKDNTFMQALRSVC